MHGIQQAEQSREYYENLLAEVREIAARVRARLNELRRLFPDDESLLCQSAADSPCSPDESHQYSDVPNEGHEVTNNTPALRQRNPGGHRSPQAAAPAGL
jgi:hypothetical protein